MLSRKGILITDPSVKEMSATQWLFELESLYHREETRYEEMTAIGQVIRQGTAAMLGLNLMPVAETIGVDAHGDNIVRYRRPDEHEFLPLALLAGREEIVSEIVKRQREMAEQDELEQKEVEGTAKHMTPEELEAFMSDEDDIIFNDPEEMRKYMISNSPEFKRTSKSLVLPMEDKDSEELFDEFSSDAPKEIGRRVNPKSKVYVD